MAAEPSTLAPTAAGDTVAGAAEAGRRPRFRRRSFLVNRRYQLRVTALAVTVVLVLLVFLNLALYQASVRSSADVVRVAPELEPFVRAQDRVLVYLILAGSVVFLVGVFLVSILETHKTAGAALALERRLREVAAGRLNVQLRLRRDDNLRELESTFNLMTQNLQDQAWTDVERLEALAERLERSREGSESAEIAEDLLRLTAELRDRLD